MCVCVCVSYNHGICVSRRVRSYPIKFYKDLSHQLRLPIVCLRLRTPYVTLHTPPYTTHYNTPVTKYTRSPFPPQITRQTPHTHVPMTPTIPHTWNTMCYTPHCVWIYVCVCVYLCVYLCVYVCMCVCVYVCMCMCVYVDMCIHVCITVYICLHDTRNTPRTTRHTPQPHTMCNLTGTEFQCSFEMNKTNMIMSVCSSWTGFRWSYEIYTVTSSCLCVNVYMCVFTMYPQCLYV
jgi:hypothetical protein